MNITIGYSWWFILLCVLLAAGYAAILYYRERHLNAAANWLKGLLAVVRFAAVFFIAFLLLGPLIKTTIREVEKPVVIFALDNTQSIVAGQDSGFYTSDFITRVQSLKEAVGKTYDVRTYTFGAALHEADSLNFSEKATNLSQPLEELFNRYSNRNVGAVVLATDGIYNLGGNPLYTDILALQAPVYTLALGDTTVKRDLLIKEVASNQIAFLNNQFPVEILVSADKLEGKTANLQIVHDGKTVFSEAVDIAADNFSKPVRALLTATEVGVQRYTVSLSVLPGEEIITNNHYDVFIEVLDSRQKILLLANAPHPDLNALSAAISGNQNYEVELRYASSLPQSIQDYNLVILHQLPSIDHSVGTITDELIKKRIPMFCIIGSQSNFNRLKELPVGLTIIGYQGRMNEVYPKLNTSFNAFKFGESFGQWLRNVPPVSVPFGKVVAANSAEVLFYQRIGSVETTDPLLAVNRVDGQKNAVLLGTGMWRWRLYNYATEKNTEAFDGFISSLVQYLALKSDQSFFRINSKHNFLENEDIVFQAELYNESYQLINDIPVTIRLKNEDQEEFEFAFSRTADAYRLNAGRIPPGTYTYVASTAGDGKNYRKSGTITVRPFHLEKALTRANHALLYNLSAKTGGAMFYPSQMEQLEKTLQQSEEIKSVSTTRELFRSAINLKWLFFLILALLSLEWFVRKRQGAY